MNSMQLMTSTIWLNIFLNADVVPIDKPIAVPQPSDYVRDKIITPPAPPPIQYQHSFDPLLSDASESRPSNFDVSPPADVKNCTSPVSPPMHYQHSFGPHVSDASESKPSNFDVSPPADVNSCTSPIPSLMQYQHSFDSQIPDTSESRSFCASTTFNSCTPLLPRQMRYQRPQRLQLRTPKTRPTNSCPSTVFNNCTPLLPQKMQYQHSFGPHVSDASESKPSNFDVSPPADVNSCTSPIPSLMQYQHSFDSQIPDTSESRSFCASTTFNSCTPLLPRQMRYQRPQRLQLRTPKTRPTNSCPSTVFSNCTPLLPQKMQYQHSRFRLHVASRNGLSDSGSNSGVDNKNCVPPSQLFHGSRFCGLGTGRGFTQASPVLPVYRLMRNGSGVRMRRAPSASSNAFRIAISSGAAGNVRHCRLGSFRGQRRPNAW